MSDLTNYSIETDHVVLLSFKDGRKRRVRLENLAKYLGGADLEKIRKALNLRRHFLRIHMPRFFVLMAAAGGLIAVLAVGGKTVASLLVPGHAAPQAAPDHTGIARSQILPTPALTSDPQQPAVSSSRLTAYHRRHAATATKNGAQVVVPTVNPVPVVELPVSADQPTVPATPTALPSPVPTTTPAPVPAPTSSPAVPAPAPGQVLGTSTSSSSTSAPSTAP